MKKGNFCPLIKKDCVEHRCRWYSQIRGTDPNTGSEIDEWVCAINLLPVLLMDNTRRQRGTNAAVEDLRNETAKQNDSLNQVLFAVLTQNQFSNVQETSVKVLSNQTG